MISVLVITKNEEHDLPGCLESVAWSDDVHVFDSFSADGTREVARRCGAHFTQRIFDSYASQRNAALTGLTFKYDWIFILDADERPTKELAAEMLESIATCPEGVNGFSVQRRDFWMGTWLKHAQLTPFYIRLVQKNKARYRRDVNEVLEVDGETRLLKAPLDHYPFSKGVRHWIDKHNTYSSMEAAVIASRESEVSLSWRAVFLERDFYKRRVALKAVFYRSPARPLVKWVYMMFVRGAVLDGRAGVAYSTLQAIYEYFIVLKTRERIEIQGSNKVS